MKGRGKGGSPPAQLATGVVKSYNGEKGYGFLTATGFPGDLMFMRTDLPADAREVRGKFIDGRTVHFTQSPSADGKLKASDLTIIAAEGDFMAGSIKSFSQRHGYGFITSSMSPGEDARFEAVDLEDVPQGSDLKNELVIYKSKRMTDGKLRVEKMMFQSKKIGDRLKMGLPPPPAAPGGQRQSGWEQPGWNQPPHPPQNVPGLPGIDMNALRSVVEMLGGSLPNSPGGKGNGVKRNAGKGYSDAAQKKPKPAQDSLSASATGDLMAGIIKSFNPTKGFGFINADGVQGDIFFMRTDMDANINQEKCSGTAVSFDLVRAADGKMRANNIYG